MNERDEIVKDLKKAIKEGIFTKKEAFKLYQSLNEVNGVRHGRFETGPDTIDNIEVDAFYHTPRQNKSGIYRYEFEYDPMFMRDMEEENEDSIPELLRDELKMAKEDSGLTKIAVYDLPSGSGSASLLLVGSEDAISSFVDSAGGNGETAAMDAFTSASEGYLTGKPIMVI